MPDRPTADDVSAARPNVLLVFADQMRGSDLAFAGHPDVVTPNFDRLARDGVHVPRMYANCPICGPSRGSLFTGQYPTSTRLMFNDLQLPTDMPTMGRSFKHAGYRTGYIGKWHLDGGDRERFTPPGPRRGGFDDYWAVHNCTHEYDSPRYYRDTPNMIRLNGWEPDIQTALACDFLQSHARGVEGRQANEDPFCLVLSWGPPHNPYEVVPEKFQKMYDPHKLAKRPNWMPIPRKYLDPKWSHPQTTADFYAQITWLDELMGVLLDQLDAAGLADDTIVVFTADHGEMMWSQGLLYKCVPYEESINVPMVMRYPRGLPAGVTAESMMSIVDVFPTLAGLAGVDCPQVAEGVDRAAILRGEAAADEEEDAFIALYHGYAFREDKPCPPYRGVRTRRYTYTQTTDRRPWLVFDNEADPYQLENLAEGGLPAGVMTELADRLDARLNALGDPFLPKQEMAERFGTTALKH